MKTYLTILLIAIMAIPKTYADIVFRGNEAKKIIENVEVIRYKDNISNPVYIEFAKDHEPAFSALSEWILSNFDTPDGLQLTIAKQETDVLGWTHYTLNQVINDVIVEFAPIKVHAIGQKVHSINGYFIHRAPDASFSISESQALNAAIEIVNADLYKWEVKEEEMLLKLLKGNAKATYFPKGEKVWMPMGEDLESGNTIPCWKFDVYAHEPESRAYLYINAANGSLTYSENRLHHSDSVGIAHTSYSGTRNITADYMFNGTFRLLDRSRADTIWTINNNNMGGIWPNGIEFIDGDNVWLDTLQYSYATDVHWGVEMSWDYYNTIHQRNSVDGNGANLNSLVHYGTNPHNASWNGHYMTYWPGDSTYTPFTCLDVVGHELTHGVIQHTCNLRYSRESGALNESFADIFGSVIEHWVNPDSVNNWLMGDCSVPLRSLSDPNSLDYPDTYKGNFWHTAPTDNYGVHVNSSVQNYWFYLLTMGGNGTNDNNDTYNVNGIGWGKSDSIAYRNMTYYLAASPVFINAKFEDARFYSIIAAKDLYGNCSQEMISTWNAWYAVGVGVPYNTDVEAEFEASKTSMCLSSNTVTFVNKSNEHAISYHWDFGDGDTSSLAGLLQPLTHTYTAPGQYTVTLTVLADSNTACGLLSDIEIKTNYIEVTKPIDLLLKDTVACVNTKALIYAKTNDEVFWYDDSTGTDIIYEGNPFVSDDLSEDKTFYARAVHKYPKNYVGPSDNNFGTGFSFNGASNEYLIFTVHDDMTLDSVTVYPTIDGSRTIELRDLSGNVLQSKIVDLDSGEIQIQLNFDIAPGDYQLGLNINNLVYLFRNNSGANYPYEISDLVSITGSRYSPYYYYFFYNWVVNKSHCEGNLFPVEVTMDYDPDCKPWYAGIGNEEVFNTISVFPNPSSGDFKIGYTLNRDQHIQIGIYDMGGKLMYDALNSTNSKGEHYIDVQGRSLDKGMYFIRFVGENQIETKKLIIN